MADYWKSMPRKFCEFCKCWLTDNKPSIEFHERGKRHQENVQKKLKELRKKGQKDFEAKRKMDANLRKMNEAALKAYEKDAEQDPSLAKDFETQKEQYLAEAAKRSAEAKLLKASKARDGRSKNKIQIATSSNTCSSEALYIPSAPYGQWVSVNESIPEAVDLQLPEQKETIEYKVIIEEPEPRFKIKEKTVASLSDTGVFGNTNVTFKKRKLISSSKRNVRRKDDDDDD